MVKALIALVLFVTACGVLVVSAVGARGRGRMAYCKNNMRVLGEMGAARLEKLKLNEVTETPTGREFWQEVRYAICTNKVGQKVDWIVRFGGLNPFGCPVRGEQPIDLADLYRKDRPAFDKLMGDPASIDYQGPKASINPMEAHSCVLGGDRPGNHPHGGYLLMLDLSVTEIRKQVSLKEWTTPDPALAD